MADCFQTDPVRSDSVTKLDYESKRARRPRPTARYVLTAAMIGVWFAVFWWFGILDNGLFTSWVMREDDRLLYLMGFGAVALAAAGVFALARRRKSR